MFLKRDSEAKAILESVKKSRIDTQITTDGKQPEELARTKSLSYGIMNLSNFSHLAYFGKVLGIDLWHRKTDKSGGMQDAFAFLKPYADGAQKWELQQISLLDNEIEKLKKLFVATGSRMKIPSYCEYTTALKNNDDIEVLLKPCF